MPLDLTDEKSTLVQVMAWCHQATSHYLSQCWPRSMSPNGVTRPQWVNVLKQLPMMLLQKMWKSRPRACFTNNVLIRIQLSWDFIFSYSNSNKLITTQFWIWQDSCTDLVCAKIVAISEIEMNSSFSCGGKGFMINCPLHNHESFNWWSYNTSDGCEVQCALNISRSFFFVWLTNDTA